MKSVYTDNRNVCQHQTSSRRYDSHLRTLEQIYTNPENSGKPQRLNL
jgi:hypothetical protein